MLSINLYKSTGRRCGVVVMALDSGTGGPRFESHVRHLRIFEFFFLSFPALSSAFREFIYLFGTSGAFVVEEKERRWTSSG